MKDNHFYFLTCKNSVSDLQFITQRSVWNKFKRITFKKSSLMLQPTVKEGLLENCLKLHPCKLPIFD